MEIKAILERAQHRVVQFACRIALKSELSKKDRDALKDFLQETDAELFQIFQEPKPDPGPKTLFVASRQYSVGSLVATAPSMLFQTEAITITQVTRIGNVRTGGDDTLANSVLNRKMRDIFVKLPDLVKGIRYTRAGKIFEFNFGPFMPEEKGDLLKGLLANPQEVLFFNSQLTRMVKPNVDDLNIHTSMTFNQSDVRQPFLLQLKMDINNRNHKNNLEAREIDQIFADADSVIGSHLEWLFGQGQQG